MKKLLIATAALASVALVAPANAADIPVKAPPIVVPALYNWTGLYIGPQGGAIMGQRSRVQEAPDSDDADISDFIDFGHPLHGGFAGGEVGFNWQAPGSRWVFGVEGAFSWAELEESLTCGPDDEENPQSDFHRFCGSRISGFAEARGRIGYALGPTGQFLVYITGGGVWARESELIRNSRTSEGVTAFGSFEQWATVPGWTIGGGAEWGITPWLSLKGEVLYVDLAEHTFTIVGCERVPGQSQNICAEPLKIKHEFILARMALNWRFNWGKGKAPAAVVARY